MGECISIKNATVNNLKHVSVEIPRGKIVVITGVSGSGKSSLAFDTLFAEGQRRFAQSLSSYARQFLGRMSKPDVESIDGVPPAIAIEQKVNVKNPRSTVATTTEIYDYLRLVYARIGRTYSPVSGEEVRCDTVGDVLAFLEGLGGAPALLRARLDTGQDWVANRLSLKERGYSRLVGAGRVIKMDEALQGGELPPDTMLLVDRFGELTDRTRVLSSVSDAFEAGGGDLAVFADGKMKHFCSRFERDGIVFRKPDEYLFSFNSPLGACPVCGGLGKIIGISEDLVVPDKSKSIYDGAIACWRGDKMGWFKDHMIELAPKYGIDIFTPYCKLDERTKRLIWEGEAPREGESYDSDPQRLIGINEFFRFVETQRYKIQYRFMLNRFSGRTTCSACQGTRLRKEAGYVKVAGLTISEVLATTVEKAHDFLRKLSLSESEMQVIREPLDEMLSRLQCIEEVGLGYLTLNRACNTLSGGESQRINLVTALGSSLVGSMYILDEPSIGRHSRDTERLIGVLRKLRDLGNTVVVVEHDEDIIRAADLLIDMGPRAGLNGGEIVFQGVYSQGLAESAFARSLTLQYLSGRRPRYTRERRSWTYAVEVKGAMEHNLRSIDVKFPLGVLTVVSGVSGSGKSTLVGDILYPALYRHINDAGDLPGAFKGLAGNIDRISRVEYVDQNPIGKSSRSNPVTYLKVYDLIRKLLSDQQYAKVCGFGPSFFSFNQDGGRCPECQGEGVVKIEMQFMSDVTMVCEECHGKRFKPEILDVRYRGRNVDEILSMSVAEAIDFFSTAPEPEAAQIVEKLQPLVDVGLDYLKLAQSSSTLSGGESQRIKLAYFLQMSRERGRRERILFIFDEPTTGLHFHDVERLLKAFDALLAGGHSLVVVEHNMDVIRAADWIIELGPDAGERGGDLVFAGTPEQLRQADTVTARFMNTKGI